MSQTIIITNAGRAALVNATNTGTNPITIASMGITSTAFTPSAAMTALPSELKRITALSGGATAPDTLHLTVRDEGEDAYAMRGYAFYLADGTLFAIHGQADPIVNKTASSMLLLALDVIFADINAEDLEFGDTNFMLPIATTTVYGQVKLATQAQANLGSEASAVLTPATARAALLSWLLAQDGAGSGVDADLLDGQQGSYYTNIPARLGFNPLNALLYTAADVLAKLLTVDGAGSGVDADLLDGQQGSYYADVAARLGFAPVQQGTGVGQNTYNLIKIGWAGTRLKATIDNSDIGNFVFDNNIADVWRASNDGAGSGLDADLLDGQQGSYYANIPARLGFAPVQQGTGVGQSSNLIKIGWDGVTRLKLTVDNSDQGALILEREIADVWRASNDGSGSGLDADLLDGAQLSELVKKTDFSQSLAAGGYQILPSGLCLQWVRGAYGFNENTQALAWPITFTEVFEAFPCVSTPTASTSADVWFQLIGSPSNTGCSVMRAYSGNTGSVGATPVVFAIGKV